MQLAPFFDCKFFTKDYSIAKCPENEINVYLSKFIWDKHRFRHVPIGG